MLAAIGVRRDGQKVLLSIRNMGGESKAAWRTFLDDLDARGLGRRRSLSPTAPRASRRRWPSCGRIAGPALHGSQAPQPSRPCAQAPARRADRGLPRNDLRGDQAAIEQRRKAFLHKWRLKCKAVADSLEEAADRLFTFTRLDPSQWKSARTTNAIERLHEEFRRRIKTQAVLPDAETAPMLFWALMASGQIVMRKVDGWKPFLSLSILKPLTSPPDAAKPHLPENAKPEFPPHFATPPIAAVPSSARKCKHGRGAVVSRETAQCRLWAGLDHVTCPSFPADLNSRKLCRDGRGRGQCPAG